MAITPSWPGVYVQEIPSGARSVAGASTSVTAFVGRARRGATDGATRIAGWGDFERAFGGLWLESPLSFAVRDYFTNGGGQALIVRVTGAGAAAAQSGPWSAANPGGWGNGVELTVDHATSDAVAAKLGLTAADLFNLTVRDRGTGQQERFINLSAADSARQVGRVLARESSLVRCGALPARPDAGAITLSNGADGGAPDDLALIGDANARTGLYALETVSDLNLVCVPPPAADSDVGAAVLAAAAALCERRRAMLIIDPPAGWTSAATAAAGLGDLGVRSANAAVYFPRLLAPNPLREGQVEAFAPCGAVAGVIARTDSRRGVWKAPAGTDAGLSGVTGLSVSLTESDNGQLNPLGVNCLRALPNGSPVVWGARTRVGDDRDASEWKYLPVRRLALFIEESLFRGTQWVVFEPNDDPLWAQIRLSVGAFMNNLFRQGAFAGASAADAYFVRCDKTTTTPDDVRRGVVNVVIGFAPVHPAEFVILQIQQIAGQGVS